MRPYVFPGYPAFLESAEAELGLPGSAIPARRISAVAALANLCAQAALADPGHVAGILAKAADFRDQLATALRAAELMIADVEAGRTPEPEPEPEPAPGPIAPPDPSASRPHSARPGRAQARHPREVS